MSTPAYEVQKLRPSVEIRYTEWPCIGGLVSIDDKEQEIGQAVLKESREEWNRICEFLNKHFPIAKSLKGWYVTQPYANCPCCAACDFDIGRSSDSSHLELESSKLMKILQKTGSSKHRTIYAVNKEKLSELMQTISAQPSKASWCLIS